MRTALLIIDVQRGLFDEMPRPYEADAVIDRINQLAARARGAGTPVIFIQHETPKGNLEYNSAGWQLESHLITANEDIFLRKTTPDAFLRTDLLDHLTARDTDQLVICGYASEFCVDTTIRRAAALGFPVILASDAHTTHDKDHASGAQIRQHHNATLPNITSFGPRIEAKPAAEISFIA